MPDLNDAELEAAVNKAIEDAEAQTATGSPPEPNEPQTDPEPYATGLKSN